MGTNKRYAIVTPYYKEARWMLERCIRSVRAQTVPADHFMIADGFPQDWIDGEPVRHLKLDRSHADYGNTPRTIGGLLAVSEGYDGIGFLDADNWLETNHVSGCIEASLSSDNCDYVVAQRNFCRPDGSVLNVRDAPISIHVDTSCFFLLPGSYHVIPHFSLTPNVLAPICDRVFLWALKARKLSCQVVQGKTVNYHCLWPDDYRRAGEIPPPEATRRIDYRSMREWLNAQTPRQLEIIASRCGSTAVFDHVVKFQQARQLHRTGKSEQAEALYQAILDADPDNPGALHFLGLLHAQRGDYERAVDLIGSAIALAPNYAMAHYNHGKALRDANRREEALASYDRAVALMPANLEAWSNRGAILQELGRLDEAIQSFDRALAINPSHVPSRHNRAKALRDLSRNNEAMAGSVR
jgi:Flp pilus assembly protein TadD